MTNNNVNVVILTVVGDNVVDTREISVGSGETEKFSAVKDAATDSFLNALGFATRINKSAVMKEIERLNAQLLEMKKDNEQKSDGQDGQGVAA